MKKWLIFCIALIISVCACAEEPRLAWDPSTNYVDGTYCQAQGFKLYWGPTSGNYTYTQDVGNVTNVLMPSVWNRVFFAVTQYDYNNNESGFSNELMYNGWIPVAPVLNSLSYAFKTGKMTASWVKPTMNTDGSTITSTGATIAGYIISYGNSSGIYTQFTNLPVVTSVTISIPTNSGLWYFVIQASNINQIVSAKSLEWSSGTSLPNKPNKLSIVR